MAGPTIIAHGTAGAEGDATCSGILVRRGRSGARASPSPAPAPTSPRSHARGPRRRRLRRQRPEGVVLLRPRRRLLHPARPHRGRARRSTGGSRTCCSTCTRPASRSAAAADHRRPGVQRDLLDRRAGPGVDARRGGRGLGRRDDHADARARHARLRADRPAGGALRRLVDAPRSNDRRAPATRCPGPDRRAVVDLQALRFTNYRALTALMKTGVPGPGGLDREAALVRGEPAADRARPEVLGPDGARRRGGSGGYWQYQQLRSRGNTIEAGTSEILREHHRRAGGRPAQVASYALLMDFAFTDDQERSGRRPRVAGRPVPAERVPRRGRDDGWDPAPGRSSPSSAGSARSSSLLSGPSWPRRPGTRCCRGLVLPVALRRRRGRRAAVAGRPPSPGPTTRPGRCGTPRHVSCGPTTTSTAGGCPASARGARHGRRRAAVVVAASRPVEPVPGRPRRPPGGRAPLPTVDSTRRLGGLRLDGPRPSGWRSTPAWRWRVRRRALALLACEAAGVAQRALDLAVEHAGTRTSSTGRSARTRGCRTGWPTSTSRWRWPARSRCGRPGRGARRPRPRARRLGRGGGGPERRSAAARSPSRSMAGSGSPGTTRSTASTSGRSGSPRFDGSPARHRAELAELILTG